jgi:tRNA A37 methylthiotransferase MiaB
MKKIFIYVHGCERRGLDASRTIKYLSENNYTIVDNPTDADTIIFFACAALNSIADESIKKIKGFQKYNAELIVAGCLPVIEKEKLARIFNGKIISTRDIEKIDTLFPGNKIKYRNIDDANIVYRNFKEFVPLGVLKKGFKNVESMEKVYVDIKNHVLKGLFGEHAFIYRFLPDPSLYHVRISTGCLGNCSYCSIKKGIGDCVSKPIDECINEFINGLNQGYKRLTIDGDDTGAYGLDIDNTFPELLYKITEIDGDYRISIRNLHPVWIVRYIDDLEIILKRKKIHYIETPIQSGCARILKLMKRYSDVERMKDAIFRLKKSFPDISLVTDYIIGFPMETEEDFKQTLNYLKEIEFSAGMIVPFSCTAGTEASNIEPKVGQWDVLRRIKFAKKFLKNLGYHVVYFSRKEFFLFWNESYKND